MARPTARTSDNADLIEIERRCFVATGNAMHVWAAYSLARVVHAPPPEWVLRYFDYSARNVLRLSAEALEAGGKDLGPKIAKAFRLGGTGASSPLTQYHHDWLLFGMRVRERMMHGDKEYFAIEAVANVSGVSPSTVRRGWKLYDKLFPSADILPDDIVNAELSEGRRPDGSAD